MKRSAAVATPKQASSSSAGGARAPKSGGGSGIGIVLGAAAAIPATAPSSLNSNASSSDTLVNGANGSLSDESPAASPSPPVAADEEEEEDLDWRAPQRLLEGVVTFPSLFWWDEAAAGRMTLAALMKIGLVYSLVWAVKRVHTTLISTILVRFYYSLLIDLWAWLFSKSFSLVKVVYNIFNTVVANFPIKAVGRFVFFVEYNTWWSYHYADCYLAFRIKEWIRNHPRTQETASQLMDDLLHSLKDKSCKAVHPNSQVSTSERIRLSREGLQKLSGILEVDENDDDGLQQQSQ